MTNGATGTDIHIGASVTVAEVPLHRIEADDGIRDAYKLANTFLVRRLVLSIRLRSLPSGPAEVSPWAH